MGSELAKRSPLAAETFAEANEILGYELSRICWQGPEESLNETSNTQPALMVHSVAVWRVLKAARPEISPSLVAGHSMGELSALVASGSMSFEDALRLVRRRGELMKRAGEESPGGMGALLGLEIPVVEKICADSSIGGEIVQIANDNCPGQIVISGDKQALERAMEQALEAGARKAVPLAVSIAAHSPLMASAQADFINAVDATPIQPADIPVIGNVTAAPLTSVAEIKGDLGAQLTSRVRWTETIEHMLSAGIQNFIELGSGGVLSGLIKRIDRKSTRVPLGTPEDFAKLEITL